MSRLGVGHVRIRSLEPAKKPDKAGVTRDKSKKPGHIRVIYLEPDKE
jgi:hypothetical protein